MQTSTEERTTGSFGSCDFLKPFEKVTTEHTGLGDATQLAAFIRVTFYNRFRKSQEILG
jgi:hypothetical protein